MTNAQKVKCHAIIHGASVLSGAVGAIPIVTFADSFMITPVQISMTIALGQVFGQEITKNAAEGVAASQATAAIGKAASKVILSGIPVIGNIANGAVAASITETLGWLLVAQFDKSDGVATDSNANGDANSPAMDTDGEANGDADVHDIDTDDDIVAYTNF